jgi:hypothetical protein
MVDFNIALWFNRGWMLACTSEYQLNFRRRCSAFWGEQMSDRPDSATDLSSAGAQDREEQTEAPGSGILPRWSRPVVTIVPIKMTLSSSGTASDGMAHPTPL